MIYEKVIVEKVVAAHWLGDNFYDILELIDINDHAVKLQVDTRDMSIIFNRNGFGTILLKRGDYLVYNEGEDAYSIMGGDIFTKTYKPYEVNDERF